jgi:hypothetical protein
VAEAPDGRRSCCNADPQSDGPRQPVQVSHRSDGPLSCIIFLELISLLYSSLTTDGGPRGLSKQDVSKVLTAAPYSYTYDAVREALKSAGDSSGRVDIEDFAEVVSQLRQGAHLAASTADTKGRVKLGGSTGGSAHTINEDERTEFTRHINAVSLISLPLPPFCPRGYPRDGCLGFPERAAQFSDLTPGTKCLCILSAIAMNYSISGSFWRSRHRRTIAYPHRHDANLRRMPRSAMRSLILFLHDITDTACRRFGTVQAH